MKSNTEETKLYEQGDVLFFTENIPENLEKLETNIIEHGEHTGHAHRLDVTAEFEHLQNPTTKERWLRVVTPSILTHEEHAPITLPPGTYRIGRVREKGMFDDLIAPVID